MRKEDMKKGRGRDGTRAMSYYLDDEVVSALALKSLKESKTKSEVVRDALRKSLDKEIKELKTLK